MFYTLKLTKDVRTIFVEDYNKDNFKIVYSTTSLALQPIKLPEGAKVTKSTDASLTATIPKDQFDKFLMTMILEQDWEEKTYKPSSFLEGYSHTHVGYHDPNKFEFVQDYYDNFSGPEYIRSEPLMENLSNKKCYYLYNDLTKISMKDFMKLIKVSDIGSGT